MESEKLLQIVAEPWLRRDWTNLADLIRSNAEFEILKGTIPAFDQALKFDDFAKRFNSGNEGGLHTALTYYRSVDELLSIMQAMYAKEIARQEKAFSESIASNYREFHKYPYVWEQNRQRIIRPLEELKSKAAKISDERILFMIYVTAVLTEKYKVEIGPVKYSKGNK
mgnify:CR=1 FL=1